MHIPAQIFSVLPFSGAILLSLVNLITNALVDNILHVSNEIYLENTTRYRDTEYIFMVYFQMIFARLKSKVGGDFFMILYDTTACTVKQFD